MSIVWSSPYKEMFMQFAIKSTGHVVICISITVAIYGTPLCLSLHNYNLQLL